MNRLPYTFSLVVVASAAMLADSHSIPAPYFGQHVGAVVADLNNDGAPDLLFGAGRHWVDQSYALINLGAETNEKGGFKKVRFSGAVPLGPPGGYYQIDVMPSSSGGDESTHTKVLLVGGTCHIDKPNSLGSCKKGENTPARLLHVSPNENGCSIHNPEAECDFTWELMWEHPDPKGDRNGGFATFNGQTSIVLTGQGGVEIFQLDQASNSNHQPNGEESAVHYAPAFHLEPPEKTDPRSDYSRYAGFAAGNVGSLGGVVACGRRSDYDEPQLDEDDNVVSINKIIYESESTFESIALQASGEPYPGDEEYSLQSTNYHFSDIDGDGVDDLIEATFLYAQQRVKGYPLPQRIHFLNEDGSVKDTSVLLEIGEGGAGRSATSGNIYHDSVLPDVVFASAEGRVYLFANRGTDHAGNFLGLEKRDEFALGTDDCQIRDVEVAEFSPDVAGVVCAVTCKNLKERGGNHIFYIDRHARISAFSNSELQWEHPQNKIDLF